MNIIIIIKYYFKYANFVNHMFIKFGVIRLLNKFTKN